MCYLSIKLSIVSHECKIAKLKPLYKKGKKTDPKNYRPISLLPVISKVLDKVIHDQTMEFAGNDKWHTCVRDEQKSNAFFSSRTANILWKYVHKR